MDHFFIQLFNLILQSTYYYLYRVNSNFCARQINYRNNPTWHENCCNMEEKLKSGGS